MTWAPRPTPLYYQPEDRGLWVGPLQRLVTPVPDSGGWLVVAQEQRGVDGGNRWHISPAKGDGEPLFWGVFEGYQRDAEIARQVAFINRPLYPGGKVPYRDFTCPHCHLTERDGGTDRPVDKKCVYCCKAAP